MDTIDQSDSKLPAPFSAAPPLLRSLAPTFSSDLATAPQPSSQINFRTIMRGLTRHWWHILLLWLVVTAPIVGSILYFMKPTFEAFSLLQIEPTKPDLFGQQQHGGLADYRSVEPYLNTQAALITSDRVLKSAVTRHEVVNLPWVVESEDATTDLRAEMAVEIVPDAFLIRVALELPDGKEAALIVNSVVDTYMEVNVKYKQDNNAGQRTTLEAQLKKLASEITAKKAALKPFFAKGTVDPPKPELNRAISKSDDEATQPTFSSLAHQHVESIVSTMVKTDIELLEARANLEVLEKRIADAKEGQSEARAQADKELEAMIRDEFQKDPDVVAVTAEFRQTQDELERVKEKARRGDDPARRYAEKQLKKLTEEYNSLWQLKHDEIRERLEVAVVDTTDTIDDLKMKVEVLLKTKDDQAKLYEKLKIEKKAGNDDTFEATYLNIEVTTLLKKQEQVQQNLDQLVFEAQQEIYHVRRVDPAVAPTNPTNNKRTKYLAAAPVGVLFMVVGLFLLLEMRAERVGDPDSLSTCVRSEVYALPRLPTPREIRLSAPKADEQVEQFVQRLDHLRFALCGSPAELGKGRCVLITSAIGGEGKTTLALQLAARCGNAGMSTLLIDGDLRRAALSPLLEVPESPGLSDMLKDEATRDDAVIAVQDGTFYLLPAGTKIQDTSRVLQSRSFGLLITQLRQDYDVIILDSPPVLPVPDALILGRWADGAVLAARYDISRFSQVERARRQLDNAGIAILGTVINGMRNAESYYGRYSYQRR